jgi:hypothetical protein
MPRQVDFPVFDADTHLYEGRDAFTRHLPREYDGLIRYVEVKGRDPERDLRHGLATRFPKLLAAFKRCVWVHDEIESLPTADQAKVMGGNLAGIMRVPA